MAEINTKEAYWYPASILQNTVAYDHICRYLQSFDLDRKDLFVIRITVIPQIELNPEPPEPEENPSFTHMEDYIMEIDLSVFNNYRLDGKYSQFEEIALAFTRLFFNKYSHCTFSL